MLCCVLCVKLVSLVGYPSRPEGVVLKYIVCKKNSMVTRLGLNMMCCTLCVKLFSMVGYPSRPEGVVLKYIVCKIGFFYSYTSRTEHAVLCIVCKIVFYGWLPV